MNEEKFVDLNLAVLSCIIKSQAYQLIAGKKVKS